MHVVCGVRGTAASQAGLQRVLAGWLTGSDTATVLLLDADDQTEAAAADAAAASAATVEVTPLSPRTGAALITAATEAEAEQIILAGGRRSPLGKIQLDRLTQYVVLNAPMTVTLVR
jgi:nucleotide-binding universal stress UspA family protein